MPVRSVLSSSLSERRRSASRRKQRPDVEDQIPRIRQPLEVVDFGFGAGPERPSLGCRLAKRPTPTR